jgi:hypothetical protein
MVGTEPPVGVCMMPRAIMGGASGRWDYDVAVIGGGPGGSSVATALVRRGRSVVVLERERFPRFHIGESQLPWINEVLHALGVREVIAASGFVEKWGARFRGPDGAEERYADFQNALETPTPQTFQVLRERFDEILLRHSEKCGARALQSRTPRPARVRTARSETAGDNHQRLPVPGDAGRRGRPKVPCYRRARVRAHHGRGEPHARRAGELRPEHGPELL